MSGGRGGSINLEVFKEIMKALGNDIRLRMLYLLIKEPHTVYDLSKKLDLSYPLAFLHLKQLKKAGLVREVARVERRGPLPSKLYVANEIELKIDKDLILRLFEGEEA